MEMFGEDSFLPLDHPWWLPAMTREAAFFTIGSFVYPSLPGWRELSYSVVPLPEKCLPFPKTTIDKYAGLPVLPSSKAILPIFSLSTLTTPHGELGSIIESGMLLLSLGDSFAKVPPSSPAETFLQLLAPDSDAPTLPEVPSQEYMHGSLHELSDDAPTSTSEVAGDFRGSPSEISANTPPIDP